MNDYIVGNTIRLSVTFTDPTVAPTDPAYLVDPQSVNFKVRSPKGVTTNITGTRDSQGHYYADVNADQTGEWVYGAYGTGTIAAAAEGEFRVVTSFD